VNADRTVKRSLNQNISDIAGSKRNRQLEQLARESVIAQQLTHLASRAEVADAWLEYDATLREIKASDLDMLSPIELAFEEGDEADLEQLPSRIHLLTRSLRSDLQDAWARLRARSLIEGLREAGSLRKLASEIHVSAPYLSQLSNGAGPVPSERILARLEAGLRAAKHQVPATPAPPGDTLKLLDERIEEVAKRLILLGRRRAKPVVSVEFPDPRIRKHLEDCLGALANRFVDPEEGKQVEELLAALVSADGPELSQWARLARNDSVRELVAMITRLNDEQRDATLALVKSIPAPEPAPQGPVFKKALRPL
jgi:DNA-binding transcriptional regulator YdaS (Cro superfamily)